MKKQYIIPGCKEYSLIGSRFIAESDNLGNQGYSGGDYVKGDVWDNNSNGSSMWDLYDDQLNK